MRIIITGGTGLIGTALATHLVKAGHEVYSLSRKPSAHTAPSGVKLHKWDAKTGEGWSELITEDTAIVNLAGAGIADKRWSDERKAEIINSRINAANAIIDAVQRAGIKPKVVIQASAVGYYGSDVGDTVLTEDSPAGHDFLADVCVQWENAIQPIIEQGVRVAIIRTGVVLSMYGGAFPRQILPFRLFVGGSIGNGEQYYPWIHIDDEVAAITFLLENENASGPYNLTAPHPVTNQEFTHVLGRVMKRPAVFPVPAMVFKILFGEMSVVLLKGQNAHPARLKEAGFTFAHPEPTEAVDHLLHHT
ncbi:MAG: TIGR01777 family protein [Phototrophicales bacterium]|nr:MAG: TIGR01777 family protein [Phototrophicales bacterium]